MTPGCGVVAAVSEGPRHSFSKIVRDSITLIANHGIEGGAHAGPFVTHRYLARWRPKLANNRQVHLIESEVFDWLAEQGFAVGAGELGENITTSAVDLRRLPLGAQIHLGPNAIVELSGLRKPCVLIDRFQRGLLKEMVRKSATPHFLTGVFGVVQQGGIVRAGDAVTVVPPAGPAERLPVI